MTKTDLIDAIASGAKLTKKQAAEVVALFCDVVAKSLKKGKNVTLIGFGTFKVSTRKAREGRNPRTGAKIKIAARKVVSFTPGKGLKETVNK